jgi:Fur family transcriptional regulator, zinc uptake regulator
MPDRDIPKSIAPGGRLSRKRGPALPATMLDQSILLLLTRASAPLSAYDLAERLREEGRRVVPMSVYRALDRLCARDQVHKVEMLSAYRVKDVAQPILMICIGCGAIDPLPAPDLHSALAASLERTDFAPRRIAFEVAGLCAGCRANDPS